MKTKLRLEIQATYGRKLTRSELAAAKSRTQRITWREKVC